MTGADPLVSPGVGQAARDFIRIEHDFDPYSKAAEFTADDLADAFRAGVCWAAATWPSVTLPAELP